MPPPALRNVRQYPLKGKKLETSTGTSSRRARIALSAFQFDGRPPMRINLCLSSPPSAALTRALQSLPPEHCHHNFQSKMWIFSFELYDRVLAIFETDELRAENLEVDVLPSFLVRGLKAYLNRINTLPNSSGVELNITSNLMNQLMPFQIEGIRFVIARGGRAMIADEMGCGKTIQAISVLQHYRQHWPALIILPPNLMDQWKGELLRFCNGLINNDDVCFVKKTSDKVSGRLVAISYSIIEKVVETGKISPDMFGLVIADESHNLKSPDAQRTKAVLPFLRRARVALCLSGTPALGRPVELFTQISALLPGVFNDYNQFILRYCDAKPSRFAANVMEAKGSSNEAELRLLLESMVMIRRLKADVVTLPTKTRIVRYVDADSKFVRAIVEIQKRASFLEAAMKDPRKDDAERQALKQQSQQTLTEYYALTGLSKIKAIREELFRQIDEARLGRAIEYSHYADNVSRDDGVDSKSAFVDLSVDEDVDIAKEVAEEVAEVMALEPVMDRHITDDDVEVIEVDSTVPTGVSRRDSRRVSEDNAEDLVDSDVENEANVPAATFKTAGKRLRRTGPSVQNNSNGRNKRQRTLDDLFANDDDDDEDDESCSDYQGCDSEGDGDVDLFRDVALNTSSRGGKKKSVIQMKKSDESKRDLAKSDGTSVRLGKKILVFAHHQKVLNAIEKCLQDSNVAFVRVDGKTQPKKKTMLLESFNNDPSIDVALLAITACGTGLNLTVANVAMFAELYWTPGVVLQAEDRIHRIGQKSKEVKIIYVLGRNTADDIVWEQIQKKQNMLEATIGNGGHQNNLGAKSSSGKASASAASLVAQQARLDTFLKPPEQVPQQPPLRTEPVPPAANIDTVEISPQKYDPSSFLNFAKLHPSPRQVEKEKLFQQQQHLQLHEQQRKLKDHEASSKSGPIDQFLAPRKPVLHTISSTSSGSSSSIAADPVLTTTVDDVNFAKVVGKAAADLSDPMIYDIDSQTLASALQETCSAPRDEAIVPNKGMGTSNNCSDRYHAPSSVSDYSGHSKCDTSGSMHRVAHGGPMPSSSSGLSSDRNPYTRNNSAASSSNPTPSSVGTIQSFGHPTTVSEHLASRPYGTVSTAHAGYHVYHNSNGSSTSVPSAPPPAPTSKASVVAAQTGVPGSVSNRPAPRELPLGFDATCDDSAPSSNAGNGFTREQLERMERNKQDALRKRLLAKQRELGRLPSKTMTATPLASSGHVSDNATTLASNPADQHPHSRATSSNYHRQVTNVSGGYPPASIPSQAISVSSATPYKGQNNQYDQRLDASSSNRSTQLNVAITPTVSLPMETFENRKEEHPCTSVQFQTAANRIVTVSDPAPLRLADQLFGGHSSQINSGRLQQSVGYPRR